jgi:hypothetical protein
LELDDERPDRARELFEVGVELAKQSALGDVKRQALVGLGEAMVAVGAVEPGAALLRRASRVGAAAVPDATTAHAAIGLARAMLLQGLKDDAIRYAMKGIADACTPLVRARGYLLLGEANVVAGQIRQGKAAWAEGAKLAIDAGNGILGAIAEERVEELELQERLDAQRVNANL